MMAVSPPRPSGPPLNALRAFEAAARHASFTAAAEELCVTPGAVAQHVKALEAWAGAKLFHRHAQGVSLTSVGFEVLPGFVLAFDRMGDAVQALRSRAAPNRVHIAALPSIAHLWLSHRLPGIRTALPEVAISITAQERPPNLRREPFDLSIFFEAEPDHPEMIVCGSDEIFPVCAPEIGATLRTPADLSNVTCLHDSAWDDDWAIWMRYAGAGADIHTGGPLFSLYSLVLEEAKNGAGVAIGHELLARPLLASGALVAPFASRVALDRKLTIGLARQPAPDSPLATVLRVLTASAPCPGA